MKTFAKIIVSAVMLFAYAPAFAHGSGHSGMNGSMNSTMNGGNNSHNGMTTNTTHNTSTKTGNLSNRSRFFLRTEERILKFEINKLKIELARLQTQLGPNSPKVIALQNQILRDGTRLFQIETKLGQLVIL